MNATNTVFDAKRLIGRKFTDPSVQADMKHWPFNVVSGPGGTPIIEVDYKGEKKQFKAEEVSSMVLIKMKEIAEAYLGKEVCNIQPCREKVSKAPLTRSLRSRFHRSRTPLLLSPPTLTIPRGRPPRTLVLSPASTSSVSSMSPPPPPSPTASTRRARKRTSSSSTSEEVPLMSPSSPSRRASLRLRPPPVTPTLEEKISITAWLTTFSRTSRGASVRT